MGLNIYSSLSEDGIISTGSLFTNPLQICLYGTKNSSRVYNLYLRNDNPLCYYTGITITPVDKDSLGRVSGTNGYFWQLRTGEKQFFPEEWESIIPGNTLSPSDIGTSTKGDIYSYIPFQLRVVIPSTAQIASIINCTLRIASTENLIV